MELVNIILIGCVSIISFIHYLAVNKTLNKFRFLEILSFTRILFISFCTLGILLLYSTAFGVNTILCSILLFIITLLWILRTFLVLVESKKVINKFGLFESYANVFDENNNTLTVDQVEEYLDSEMNKIDSEIKEASKGVSDSYRDLIPNEANREKTESDINLKNGHDYKFNVGDKVKVISVPDGISNFNIGKEFVVGIRIPNRKLVGFEEGAGYFHDGNYYKESNLKIIQ